jgi:hypothetical protein
MAPQKTSHSACQGMFTERRTEPYTQRKCDGRTGASAVLPVGPLTGENSTSPLT